MTWAEIQRLFDPLMIEGAVAEATGTIQAKDGPSNWEEAFRAFVEAYADKIAKGQIARLDREICALKEHSRHLRDNQSLVVPIETLAPEPFALKRTLHVVVRPIDDEYIATLFDANLGMTGDTAEDAVANLKATIVDTFELFEENEQNLGPEPKRQLAVLRELIEKQQ